MEVVTVQVAMVVIINSWITVAKQKEVLALQCTDNSSFRFEFKVLFCDALTLKAVTYISGLYYLT
jgi:hypothetical protein